MTDIDDVQFKLPNQTDTDQPVIESVHDQVYDAAKSTEPQTRWTEADATMVQMTGDMLSPETHDHGRWMEAMTSGDTRLDYQDASEDVMRRQREADFNERQIRKLEQENTTEAMLAIDDTQNYVITLRELHKKPGSELHGIGQNV